MYNCKTGEIALQSHNWGDCFTTGANCCITVQMVLNSVKLYNCGDCCITQEIAGEKRTVERGLNTG